MARGGRGQEAERWVVDRVRSLPGWDADNVNDSHPNHPGFDVLAVDADGRQVRVSVKSVSTIGARHDYGVGRSFERHPADVYAFVDLTVGIPWPVYLAGARTVQELAMERHAKYQADRGRTEELHTWPSKVSRGLLEEIGAREAWHLLDDPSATTSPQVTETMRRRAQEDAPRPRRR